MPWRIYSNMIASSTHVQWELGPQPERTLPGPSFDELAEIAGQCTAREWSDLVSAPAFIEAAFQSIEQCHHVAQILLGRKLQLISVKPKTQDQDL